MATTKKLTKTGSKPKLLSAPKEAPLATPPAVPTPAQTKTRSRSEHPVSIVGIGASAGGLEALEQFFRGVPSQSGLSFVVVQHLDPTRRDIMTELLQRSTAMTVYQVKDRTKVKPGCVYVIPPNRDMSILRGVLHLLEPNAIRGLRLPIDYFFRSLAQDQQERSIGVILSGMGTDGTLGLRAIKEKAGLVLVQSPTSAKFDGMPRSAIAAGVADIVATAQELPTRLLDYLRHTVIGSPPGVIIEEKSESALEKVAILLRSHTGHDFSRYKKSTVYRRIERRMGLHQIEKMADYVRYLQENRSEIDILFKELLIGVTSFFRDAAVWEQLGEQGIPALLTRASRGRNLRAWVAGCSTGEEAYSLAIVFKEALERIRPKGPCSLQVFATDLDRDAIDRARRGIYPANIAADVSPERLSRFFIKDEDTYQVNKEIREMVIFAPQNLIMDPPFTKLDILTCRNLLIYLESDLQRKLIPLFHYSLNPGGLLFLGSAESVGNFPGLFIPMDTKTKLFWRVESPTPADSIEFPSTFSGTATIVAARTEVERPIESVQCLAEQLILQKHSPPSVLANDRGDILVISGRTGRYLEPAAGKANWNIFAMARDGLRYEMASAFQKIARDGGTTLLHNLKVTSEGRTDIVDVDLHRLEEPEPLRGMILIVFKDVVSTPKVKTSPSGRPTPSSSARSVELEWELERSRSELQSTREQMQTSQEELRSMNEELQSTNEELQSTNEELTTSKEEMQSLNEELQTVNAELQAKLEELSRANNDMKNLLNSTEIATVFLDNEMNVRRFTTAAARIIKLIPTDVGRPVTDLASTLLYPDLARDAQEVLRTLIFAEKQIKTRDGGWFAVRIMPYRTLNNMIDGVVITFIDITGHRQPQSSPTQDPPSVPKVGWTTELQP